MAASSDDAHASVGILHGIIQAVVRRTLFPHLAAPGGGRAAPAPAAAAGAASSAPSTTSSAPRSAARAQHASAAARHPSARERRESIARCRTLRQEIAAFESSFAASHGGHAPKGQFERFPLAGVYEEYRARKVAIRDDAAAHIQAAYRGSRTRASLRRDGKLAPRGRGGAAGGAAGAGAGPSPASSSSYSLSSSAASAGAGAGGAGAGAGAGGLSSSALALSALREEKAALKRSLRAFDTNFAARHSRAPTKAEKEHLRPQYTRYHELKAALAASSFSQEGDDARSRRSDSIASMAGLEGGLDDDLGGGTEGEGGDGGGGGGGVGGTGARRRSSGGAGGVGGSGSSSSTSPAAAAAAGSSSASATSASSLASLKAEKKRLAAFLRDYEKSFLDRWGRPVKLVKDIAPVMDKYQRYKQLKQLLAADAAAAGGKGGSA